MTVGDIYDYLDFLAPFSSQEKWDNSGLLIGNRNNVLSSVFVCLDVTEKAINDAVAAGAQLIISHHPVIFSPLVSVSSDSVVYKIIRRGISVICAHTNLDIAPGGVNDTLCERLGLEGEASEINLFLKLCRINEKYDSVSEFAKYCASQLGTVATFFDSGKKASLIAVCSGSGGSFINETVMSGADTLLTGEAKYHEFIDAEQKGISIITLGHYATEYPVVPVLKNKLLSVFPGLKVTASEFERNIITVK